MISNSPPSCLGNKSKLAPTVLNIGSPSYDSMPYHRTASLVLHLPYPSTSSFTCVDGLTSHRQGNFQQHLHLYCPCIHWQLQIMKSNKLFFLFYFLLYMTLEHALPNQLANSLGQRAIKLFVMVLVTISTAVWIL